MPTDVRSTAINDLVTDILPILAKHHRRELEEVLAMAEAKFEETGGLMLLQKQNSRAALYKEKIKLLQSALDGTGV